jgi:predicted ABC-type ATPase
MPTVYIIAGCNGAGKTTAAYSLLPDVFTTVEFINADEIARGLSPLNPEGAAFAAGRIMLQRIEEMIERRESFAFETTLSGHTYLNLIYRAKEKGFSVVLLFVSLSTIELAKNRVETRVRKGGHNIAPDVIERRFIKGLRNFSEYSAAVDDWYLYDNSGSEYVLAACRIDGVKEIFNFEVFSRITENEKQ